MTLIKFQYCCFLVESMKYSSNILTFCEVLKTLMRAIKSETTPMALVTYVARVIIMMVMADT